MKDALSGSARTETAGRWLLAASIAAAALAVGTVHTVTLCLVAVCLTVATVLSWWPSEPTTFRPRTAATLLLITGAALTAYTAIQCIPIPAGWLAAIAPRNAEVWQQALTPLHERGPAWAPISLDPTASRVEVLKGVVYVLAFLSALRVARSRDGIAFLSGTLVVTGSVLAAAAMLHPAFGAHKLYGIYGPSTEVMAYAKHLAPFLNPNNLAAYLNVAFCLALAASLAPEPRWPRPLLATTALLLATAQIWVASRGGVATLVIGAILVVAISRLLPGRRESRQTLAGASLVIGGALATGVFMIVLGGSEPSASELLETDVSKLQLFRQALRMLPAYGVFGTGRGAFESVFPAFRDSPGAWTFTHPENVVIQWAVEWGLPIALVALATVTIALRPSTVLARSSTASGAWAALVAVAVQNLVDLGTEIPGLMLAPVVCAAIVVGGSSGRPSRWRVAQWAQFPRGLAVASGVAATAAIACAVGGIGHDLRDDRAVLLAAATTDNRPTEELHSLARDAMSRHPGEPYFPFIVGWRATRSGDEPPMAWLEGALERSPVNGPAHLVLGRILSRASPSQARMEYRFAVEQAPELLGVVLHEAAHLAGGYFDAMELVPHAGPAATPLLESLAEGLQARLPATSVRLDQELASRVPTDPGPVLRAARSAVADLEAGDEAPWCQGANQPECVNVAMDSTSKGVALAPATCEAHALRARAVVASGEPDQALAELARQSEQVTDRVACLETLVTLAGTLHDERRATDAMSKIAAAGCVEDADCASNLAWVARAEELRGNGRHALLLYRRAYARAPENDALLEAAARVATSTGLHAEAEQDYQRLARKHPTDARFQQAAHEQRDAALKSATEAIGASARPDL